MIRLFLISIVVVVPFFIVPGLKKAPKAVVEVASEVLPVKKRPRYVIHEIDLEKEKIVAKPAGSYDSIKQAITQQKIQLKARLDQASPEQQDAVWQEVGQAFTESLLNEVIPHWYGTKWDYNGYTDVPGEGLIACGYFVSTTLKHMGLNVNRYKLAQAYSLKSVEVLHGSKAINLTGVGQDSFVNYMEKQKDGFYTVGLDSHIGFVLVRNGISYFIHSSNVWPGIVCIESARKTVQFRWNNAFVLADLSNNKDFLKKWLNNTAFVVK